MKGHIIYYKLGISPLGLGHYFLFWVTDNGPLCVLECSDNFWIIFMLIVL